MISYSAKIPRWTWINWDDVGADNILTLVTQIFEASHVLIRLSNMICVRRLESHIFDEQEWGPYTYYKQYSDVKVNSHYMLPDKDRHRPTSYHASMIRLNVVQKETQ